MKKKVIFLDADGTLWYPHKTKRKEAPHWIYQKSSKVEEYLKHLVLTPVLIKTLNELRKQEGVMLVVLSTNPKIKKEADAEMAHKIKHFKLEKFFDFVLTSKDRQTGKGEVITRFLKKHKISKSRALMVGDSYKFDYLSAKSVGVKALLIETEYNLHYRDGKKLETIKHLKELLHY